MESTSAVVSICSSCRPADAKPNREFESLPLRQRADAWTVSPVPNTERNRLEMTPPRVSFAARERGYEKELVPFRRLPKDD